MNAKRQIVLLWILVVLLGGWGITQATGVWQRPEIEPPTKTVHDVVLEEVQALGKLELVKYRLKDVIEHKKANRFLPDAKVLLVIAGEVVGCLDLTKIKSEGIRHQGDTVHIRMPAPEICYSKIDHQNSKIYDTEYTIISGQANTLVADALQRAEKQLETSVREQGILHETQKNAELLLRPMLERITKKTVLLTFAEQPQ